MTGVTIHRETDLLAFTRQVIPYLMLHEAEHNIMLGLFAVLQARPPENPPILVWAERSGEIVGVAMRTPPFRTLLSQGVDAETIAALAADLAVYAADMPGVLAGKAESLAFASAWRNLTGRSVSSVRSMRLFRLTAVQPVAPVPGAMREVSDGERELVIDWWQAFALEAAEPVTREHAAQAIRNRHGVDPLVGGMRVWEVNGEVVSLAGYTGPTPNSIRIGPVYTPPQHRGHGYATALVAALSQLLLDFGFAFVTLYTDLANPTSNRIYQTIGYQPLADLDEVHFAEA